MFWLSIFNNETFLLVAETLIIVIGSMLLGILLCYINSWGLKSKFQALNQAMEEERKRTADVVNRLSEVLKGKKDLEAALEKEKEKVAEHARTIYNLQVISRDQELENTRQKAAFDRLNATIDAYQQRIEVIQQDLDKSITKKAKPRKLSQAAPVSISFEHVSKIIGRQVAENDLTLVLGVGPKTAELLKSHGVDTWDKFAETPIVDLSKWLMDAGGIYKNQDPSSWAKQASMAARGEWRKLRVFQESLRQNK